MIDGRTNLSVLDGGLDVGKNEKHELGGTNWKNTHTLSNILLNLILSMEEILFETIYWHLIVMFLRNYKHILIILRYDKYLLCTKMNSTSNILNTKNYMICILQFAKLSCTFNHIFCYFILQCNCSVSDVCSCS